MIGLISLVVDAVGIKRARGAVAERARELRTYRDECVTGASTRWTDVASGDDPALLAVRLVRSWGCDAVYVHSDGELVALATRRVAR